MSAAPRRGARLLACAVVTCKGDLGHAGVKSSREDLAGILVALTDISLTREIRHDDLDQAQAGKGDRDVYDRERRQY
jgi:hypothetical protein